jgi:hypothetical protein
MNCQRAREVFPELLDGRTAAAAHADARSHLAHCPDCQREYAALTSTAAALDAMPTPPPSSRLRKSFYAMLEEEKHSAASVRAATARHDRARRVRLWQWVLSPLLACTLVVLGFALGRRTPPAVVTAPAPLTDDSTKRELVALREQLNQQNAQIEKMTMVVGYSILQQQQNPANERLKDVLTAAQQEQPSAKVIDDLISALTLDPNANVRLRALEALYRHAGRDVVRAGVLAALPREQNPLVQLELIDFVATVQVKNATPVLERLSADETTNSSVRDAAKLVLAQL